MYSSSLKAIFTTVDNRGTRWHPLRYGQITHARSHSNSSLRGALLLESGWGGYLQPTAGNNFTAACERFWTEGTVYVHNMFL